MKTLHAEALARIQFGVAREGDFKRLPIEEIKALKSDKSVTHYRFQERAVRKDDDDPEERTFVHVASSEHVDTMGDIIRVKGWDTVRLRVGKIPLFWGHDAYPVPMGLVQSAKRSTCDDGVKCLETKSRFHEAEIFGDSEWGKHVESILKLVQRGDMPGVSVGFAPKEYHWPDEDERETLGLKPWAMIFDEHELLELSVTPIPANNRAQQRKSAKGFAEALRSLVADGKLDQATADALAEELDSGEERWISRARQLGRTIVPLSGADLSWIRGAAKSASKPDEKSEGEQESAEVRKFFEGVTQKIAEVCAENLRTTSAALRRDLSGVMRDTFDALEDGIEDAASRIEGAASRINPKAPAGEDRPAKSTTTTTTTAHGIGDSLVRALESTSTNRN